MAKGVCLYDIIKCNSCIKENSVCFQDVDDCSSCINDLIDGTHRITDVCMTKDAKFGPNFVRISNDLCSLEYSFTYRS